MNMSIPMRDMMFVIYGKMLARVSMMTFMCIDVLIKRKILMILKPRMTDVVADKSVPIRSHFRQSPMLVPITINMSNLFQCELK